MQSLLSSFPEPLRAVVFGAGGGIGGALLAALAQSPSVVSVHAGARRPAAATDPRIRPFAFDLEDEVSIAAALDAAAADGPLHLVLVATGVLHDARLSPEKTWRALDADALAHAFRINAIGPALIAKHALPKLARGQKTAFAALSARVGSIEDNRLGGWHAYRASKAALHQLVRTLSIELAIRNPTALCVSLHPGTVDSQLSRPFRPRNGQLLTPADSAARLLAVLDGLTPADTGRVFAWDGTQVPF